MFANHDRRDALPIAVVNQALATTYWPNGEAIGKRIAESGVQLDISISPVRAYEQDGLPPVAGRDPGISGVESG